MNRVLIDRDALAENVATVDRWVGGHGGTWSTVTKVLCGHIPTLTALFDMGIRSMADSRLDNLRAVSSVSPDIERWYLRPPHLSVVPDVVELADISLNSDITVIKALGKEAVRQNHEHRVVIMVEMGDLREGVLPGDLVDFYKEAVAVEGIRVVGLGAQFGCVNGAIPGIDHMAHMLIYRELLELKFGSKLPIISAGSSILLPLMHYGSLDRNINHFRIGEAIFTGADLVSGGTLPGLRNDVITLEAEIAELREKSLSPQAETGGHTPFDVVENDVPSYTPGQRGYRAVVTLGQIDTEAQQLVPLDETHQIVGASSDMMVIHLGATPGNLEVGDVIRFRPGYGAFVRLMNDPYIAKHLVSANGAELSERPLGPQLTSHCHSGAH